MTTARLTRWLKVRLPLLALILLVAAPAAQAVTFSDGVFNPCDWELIVTGTGSVTASQEPSGGNPGEFRQSTLVKAEGSNQVLGVHIYTAQDYNPAALGAVSSLVFSLDTIKSEGLDAPSTYSTVRPALRQAGKYYYYSPGLVINWTDWQNFSYGLFSSSGFEDITGAPGAPDFTAAGAPLAFGFMTERRSPDDFSRAILGVDNWSILIELVPLPPSVWLLGSGLLGLLAFRRQA